MTIDATAKPLVGVIHLPPLPGAPNADEWSVAQIVAFACEDARRLAEGGIDMILLQNANDHPPRKTVSAATVGAYSVVAAAVRRASDVPIGVSVLKSDAAASFAIANAADARFIRLKSYVGVEVGAEGLVEGCAAEAVRMRRELGATKRIEIWADAIQPTSRPLGGPSVTELAMWCATFGEADRVVVTGGSLEESLSLLGEARPHVSVPLILGGGVEPETAARALAAADGLIVGRYLRERGLSGPVDRARLQALVAAARSAPHGIQDPAGEGPHT